MEIFLKGFLLGFSLIVVIGPQNAFVIKQGLLKNHITSIIIACLLCDFVVISLGVFGVGKALENSHFALIAISIVGILFLLFYAFMSFKSAIFAPKSLDLSRTSALLSQKQAIFSILALTLLNPNFYLDALIIIGGVSATMDSSMQKACFLAGVLCVSLLWYVGVGYGVRVLLPLFKSHAAWRALDAITGLIMCGVAYYLARFVWDLCIHKLA
ncbi:hypothetical protein BKN38_05125 [Helicobacter sp. CLO-3]|nr:hypothetical protein BA723_06740 [Helicobacter sp. CLO-3]OHU83721.1 hypothetical protein BKN38_05125 [Helicobacter sp. CLO-3]